MQPDEPTKDRDEEDADDTRVLPAVSFANTAENLRLAGKYKEADEFEDLWRRLNELKTESDPKGDD